MFGVNPWRLQAWMGHKRIDETMLYVHVAQGHRRALPAEVLAAAQSESDPDMRITRMLGARLRLGTIWAPATADHPETPELRLVR
jgi:hypothetical protein